MGFHRLVNGILIISRGDLARRAEGTVGTKNERWNHPLGVTCQPGRRSIVHHHQVAADGRSARGCLTSTCLAAGTRWASFLLYYVVSSVSSRVQR